jgi:nucleoside-diphosphate-sugar epimerase
MVLVTGHLGFIGSHLSRRLDALGRPWIGLDRRPSATGRHFVCDVKSVDAFMLEPFPIDHIIHLASPVGVAETSSCPSAVRQEIAAGAKAMARSAQSLGVSLLIVSSSEVFGEPRRPITRDVPPSPISGYGRGKLDAERIALEECDRCTVVRLFNVYGTGQRLGFFIPNLLHGLRFGTAIRLVNYGRPVRQFTYAEDVAAALADPPWSRQNGATVSLAGPEPMSLLAAARIAGEICGVEPRIEFVSPEELRRAGHVEIDQRVLVQELPSWLKAWTPTTTFRDGIARILADARLRD